MHPDTARGEQSSLINLQSQGGELPAIYNDPYVEVGLERDIFFRLQKQYNKRVGAHGGASPYNLFLGITPP